MHPTAPACGFLSGCHGPEGGGCGCYTWALAQNSKDMCGSATSSFEKPQSQKFKIWNPIIKVIAETCHFVCTYLILKQQCSQTADPGGPWLTGYFIPGLGCLFHWLVVHQTGIESASLTSPGEKEGNAFRCSQTTQINLKLSRTSNISILYAHEPAE